MFFSNLFLIYRLYFLLFPTKYLLYSHYLYKNLTMELLFRKFIDEYFFNFKGLLFEDINLKLKNKKYFIHLIIGYSSSLLIYTLSIWFIIDSKSSFWIMFIFLFSFIPNLIANLYIVSFFLRNNIIPIYRGIFYFVVILLLIPFYCLYEFTDIIPQLFGYYTFYMFFLFLFFSLFSNVYYFFLNFYSNISFFIWLFLFFFKWLFIKLDSHSVKKIVNKMTFDKDIKYRKVRNHLYKLKNSFKIFWWILTIYAIINLIFGVSILSIYVDYISPFMKSTSINIDRFEEDSKWLLILFKISYIVVCSLAIYWICYFLLYTYFLYLKIYFFDLLLVRIKKENREK